MSILELARHSISSIASKTLGKVCKSTIKEVISRNWDEELSKLSVQSKFLDACDFEKSNSVWSRILNGLPAKQLSLILRASSDTHPTPPNQGGGKDLMPQSPVQIKLSHRAAYPELLPH